MRFMTGCFNTPGGLRAKCVMLERKGRSWSLETLASKCQPHPVDAEARLGPVMCWKSGMLSLPLLAVFTFSLLGVVDACCL